ncbi:hypothetical protein GCM10009767_11010 [Kocuria aegyptia]|uniref:Uncharacterized protein n=1 Tax=Kocuria aegyptia TaxID=330943 RepID=A0ABP4WFW0_9MICC
MFCIDCDARTGTSTAPPPSGWVSDSRPYVKQRGSWLRLSCSALVVTALTDAPIRAAGTDTAAPGFLPVHSGYRRVVVDCGSGSLQYDAPRAGPDLLEGRRVKGAW